MNWITIAWPMVASACLTLGLIELRIGLTQPPRAARLLFALSAFAVAGIAGLELALTRADSLADWWPLMRWLDIAVGVMMVSLTAFIWVYFGTGNTWLALAVPGLYAVGLAFDYLSGSGPGSGMTYQQITGFRTVETFGGVTFNLAEGVPNPWNVFPYLAVLVLIVFVVDASARLWRRGGRWRAAVVGGAVVVFFLVGGGQAALIETGAVQMPYLISWAYLAILVAMASELHADVLAAAQLASRLQDSEMVLQRLRSQLAHASRVSLLGQLASALAHELNQPLGAILRNAEAAELFLAQEPPDLDELRAILVDIRQDDLRASGVIERLRSLLKRRSLAPCALSVGDLLSTVAALTRGDATARKTRLEIAAAPGLPLVMGDAVHIQQVLLNLVLNAMDAVGHLPAERRQVTVGAQRRDERDLEMTVSDGGHGIAPEQLGQLFEPFFTTKPHGMGIGLAISRTIIEAHGGRIWAENNTSAGATFRFTLPLVEESTAP
ncbi:ATP-binding protein [uncultured Thiodictyon sp.]|uniref:sensor histidine kinase n=1 Tax=uncultured Thiodictyon sp. TaxID=1846217 RepID=UPI0025D293CB|nr:ATP-binding protein [uncultured Thiodictyon sp.]